MSSGMGGIGETPGGRRRARWRRLNEPAFALICVAILLPIALFALAAWQSYRVTIRDAEARAERTVRILEEHALKVFETHRLVIHEVETRMRFVDWSKPADLADLHSLLAKMQDDLDQVATVTVTDREGRMRASGRVFPFDPSISFADRDYFQALKKTDSVMPFVSRSYNGRQSGIAVFNVVERVNLATGPPAANAPFDGVIAVSVDRAYFEHFYESVEPAFDHSVVLVRDDGQILARVPASPINTLQSNSYLLAHIHEHPAGTYIATSRIDDVERIFAYRRVGAYPVYVRFGISMAAALAPWRASLIGYGLVAALASLALVGMSLLALRQTQRERLARRRWEETAAALQAEAAERGRIETQLRQAQKMEAVGRLTGGVAHDFNNLLTAVIGSLDLVRRRPDTIEPRSLELVSNALEGANRAASLTSRLLAFSRQQPLQAQAIDANRLVASMSDLFRRTLGEMIRIETSLAENLWTALADPNQLESAILNLAVNARDAMPDGGSLRISTANERVDAPRPTGAGDADLQPGEYVVMTVSDTGTGMRPEVLGSIFEPFFTTKPAGKGTGLGLSQVYGFVQQSGGHVLVQSKVGSGTSFRLYLPRIVEDAAAIVTPAGQGGVSPVPRAGRGETILVVEDDVLVRRLSVTALQDAGYRVVAVGDGPGALDLFRREPSVALLFTDVVLGGAMNGRVLADTVHLERPDLPVLFTSGYTGDAFARIGGIDPGLDFIGKPFTGAEVVARIARILRTRNHSDAAVAAL